MASTISAATASGGPLPGIALEPVRGDFGQEHAAGLEAEFLGQGHAQAAENADLGLTPEGLGIYEQAVHIEHGGPEWDLGARRPTVMLRRHGDKVPTMEAEPEWEGHLVKVRHRVNVGGLAAVSTGRGPTSGPMAHPQGGN